jgi:hypothetical protein
MYIGVNYTPLIPLSILPAKQAKSEGPMHAEIHSAANARGHTGLNEDSVSQCLSTNRWLDALNVYPSCTGLHHFPKKWSYSPQNGSLRERDQLSGNASHGGHENQTRLPLQDPIYQEASSSRREKNHQTNIFPI